MLPILYRVLNACVHCVTLCNTGATTRGAGAYPLQHRRMAATQLPAELGGSCGGPCAGTVCALLPRTAAERER